MCMHMHVLTHNDVQMPTHISNVNNWFLPYLLSQALLSLLVAILQQLTDH